MLDVCVTHWFKWILGFLSPFFCREREPAPAAQPGAAPVAPEFNQQGNNYFCQWFAWQKNGVLAWLKSCLSAVQPSPWPWEVRNFDRFLWEMLLLPALKCCFPSENLVSALLQKCKTCPMPKEYFAISWIDSLGKIKLFSCFLFHWLLSCAF